MEEAPNSDPKDELLELGFDSEGSEVNYSRNVISEDFSKNGYPIATEAPNRFEDIIKHNLTQPKKKPRIKLQDSKYGEWRKGMADLQSLPFLANIVSKNKKINTESVEKQEAPENSAIHYKDPN